MIENEDIHYINLLLIDIDVIHGHRSQSLTYISSFVYVQTHICTCVWTIASVLYIDFTFNKLIRVFLHRRIEFAGQYSKLNIHYFIGFELRTKIPSPIS